jgi:hypothetical protein
MDSQGLAAGYNEMPPVDATLCRHPLRDCAIVKGGDTPESGLLFTDIEDYALDTE